MTIKVKSIVLAEALSKELASAKRGANVSKNPTIKQCHEQSAREIAALMAQLPTQVMDLYITEIEPKK